MRDESGFLVATVAAFLLATGAHATDQMGTGATGGGSRVEVETQVGTGAGADMQAPPPAGHATGGTRVETQVNTNTGAGAPAAGAASGGTATDVEVKTLTTAPITGRLTVKDPALRTFIITGEETVYVAPEDVQLQQYQGQDVKVTFDPNGRVTTIEVDREG